MSQWTHVNGQIRIDGIPGMNTKPSFGNMCTSDMLDDMSCDEWEQVYEECDVPCGSEGSLKYTVDVVGTGMVWCNVSIWGDLRDYGSKEQDIDRIIDWIKERTEGHFIRQASIMIEVEGGRSVHMYFDRNVDDWMSEERWIVKDIG